MIKSISALTINLLLVLQRPIKNRSTLYGLSLLSIWNFTNKSIMALQSSSYSSKSKTRLQDDMTDKGDDILTETFGKIHWFHELESTMDEARKIVASSGNSVPDCFSVVTERQTKGRGTHGRQWISIPYNLFLTVAIKRTLLPIPLHLLPLRSGTLVASALANYLPNDVSIKLKWPNDLLINEKKVCGILIEMERDHFLIGIGCNIVSAPEVPFEQQVQRGARPSTALSEYNSALKLLESQQNCDANTQQQQCLEDVITNQSKTAYKVIAQDITRNFVRWLNMQNDQPQYVIDDFKRNMDYSLQRLRDIPGDDTSLVRPINLNPDGTLQVKCLHNDEEKTLVTEYLW